MFAVLSVDIKRVDTRLNILKLRCDWNMQGKYCDFDFRVGLCFTRNVEFSEKVEEVATCLEMADLWLLCDQPPGVFRWRFNINIFDNSVIEIEIENWLSSVKMLLILRRAKRPEEAEKILFSSWMIGALGSCFTWNVEFRIFIWYRPPLTKQTI